MKSTIFALLLITPSLALACMPKGDLLDQSEKAEFAKDLKAKNPRCVKTIKAKIGDLKLPETVVFEAASDNLVTYTVRGQMMMTITKVKVMGKIRYSCGKPTPLRRCI